MAVNDQQPPTGGVTFLFTDIVGSTEAWEKHGDAFLPVLQAHNAIITEAISRFGGYVVKTEGDCYKVAFQDATAAAKCALVAQAALHRYPWPQDVGPVRVRMALHTGEPFMQGGDYFGPPVNRTARILSATHGGQILISEETVSRIRGRLEAGSSLQDLGYHMLRDLGEPTRLYQLEHTALEARHFPPPRTLNGHANNLPVQRTSFVGREKEIEQIAALLTRSDAPLLTLTGPGGVGKTRLSLQVAAEQVEWFPDGVWYIALQSATDLESAAREVAETLGLEVPAGKEALGVVRSWLAERRCLLILDDCGNVRQAGHLIRELLSGAPSLRCLATARESLKVGDAVEYAVPDMELPAEDAGAADLMAAEGGRLFAERARAARPDFQLTDRRARVISRLLRRVGGLPATIEKTAAMMRSRQPTEILDAIGTEFVHAAVQIGEVAATRGKQMLERAKETPELAAILHSVGSAAVAQRDLAEAERITRRALGIYRQLGDRAGMAVCLRQLGNIAAHQRDHGRAATLLSAAYQTATEAGLPEAPEILADLESARRAAGRDARSTGITLDEAMALAMSE